MSMWINIMMVVLCIINAIINIVVGNWIAVGGWFVGSLGWGMAAMWSSRA